MMRSHGRLTFTDIQYLLTAGNRASGGSVISRQPSAEARLYIDYRLDCKLDHWLLDEFQDTSDLQWEVLANLADEILQDSSGQRSFFYVGDTKQAIYGWRGGNPHLFRMLLDSYGEVIGQRTLEASHRSCQAIVDTVNQVFGDLGDTPLPPGAIALWQRFWQKHTCAPEVPAGGCAALIETTRDGEEAPLMEPEDRYEVVARLLLQVDPLARGLSTAILVRSNAQGRALVDYLRGRCAESIIIHEGRAAIKDNPLVAVLLSLVAFAAHPGDMFAWSGLVGNPNYTAGSRAMTDCTFIEWQADKLRAEFEADARLGYVVMRAVAQTVASRLRAMQLQLVQQYALSQAE